MKKPIVRIAHKGGYIQDICTPNRWLKAKGGHGLMLLRARRTVSNVPCWARVWWHPFGYWRARVHRFEKVWFTVCNHKLPSEAEAKAFCETALELQQ